MVIMEQRGERQEPPTDINRVRQGREEIRKVSGILCAKGSPRGEMGRNTRFYERWGSRVVLNVIDVIREVVHGTFVF